MKKLILLIMFILLTSTALALDTDDIIFNVFPNNVSQNTDMYGVNGVGNNTNWGMEFDATNDYLEVIIPSLNDCDGYYNNTGTWTLTTTPFYISGTTVQIGKTGPSSFWGGQLQNVTCYDISDNVLYNNSMDGLTDLSSNKNGGRISDAIITNSNSLVFDGVDDYLASDFILGTDGSGDFTISLWLKSTDTGRQYIMDNNGGSNPRFIINLNRKGDGSDSDGHIHIYTHNGASSGSFGSNSVNPNLNDGDWHLITYTRTGSTGIIYIDGSLLTGTTGTTVSGDLDNNDGYVFMIDISKTTYPLIGSLSNIMIFDTNIISSDVTEIYNNGRNYDYFPRTPPTPPIKVWSYPYEEIDQSVQIGTVSVASTTPVTVLSGTFTSTVGENTYISYTGNIVPTKNPVGDQNCYLELNGFLVDNSNVTYSGAERNAHKSYYKLTSNFTITQTSNDIDLLCYGSNNKEFDVSNNVIQVHGLKDSVDYNFSISSQSDSFTVNDLVSFDEVLNATIDVADFNITDTNKSIYVIYDSNFEVTYGSDHTAEGYLTIDDLTCPLLQRYGDSGSTGSASYLCAKNITGQSNFTSTLNVKGDVDVVYQSFVKQIVLEDYEISNNFVSNYSLTSSTYVDIDTQNITIDAVTKDILAIASLSIQAEETNQETVFRFKITSENGSIMYRDVNSINEPGIMTNQYSFTGLSIQTYEITLQGYVNAVTPNVSILSGSILYMAVGESDLDPNSFTITATDTIFSTAVQSFTASDGIVLSTTTGSIEYPKQSGLINLTFSADNYFNSTVLNWNTTANLEFNATPYAWLNLTANNILTAAVIENFTIDCNSYGNYTADGLYLMYQLQEGLNNTDVVCDFYHPDYADSNFTVTGVIVESINDYNILASTTNSVNFTFVDVESGLPITENVTIELIGNVETYSEWTEDGWVYIDLINPDSYTARYDAFGYNQNFYSFTMVNKTTSAITLYMSASNSTEVITATVLDENAREIEGVLIKVFEESFDNSTEFVLSQISFTNFEGVTELNLRTGTVLYYFVLEYPEGTTKKITNPTYIYDNTLSFQIVIGELPGQDYADSINIYTDMYFAEVDNTTDSFYFEWNDGNNIATQGCIRLYDINLIGQTYLGEQCSLGVSGSVTYNYAITNGTTKKAEGVLYFDGNYSVYNIKFKEYPLQDGNIGRSGVFGILILLLLFGTLLATRPSLLLLFAPLPLSMAKWGGLVEWSWPILIGLHFVFAALAYLISDRG